MKKISCSLWDKTGAGFGGGSIPNFASVNTVDQSAKIESKAGDADVHNFDGNETGSILIFYMTAANWALASGDFSTDPGWTVDSVDDV